LLPSQPPLVPGYQIAGLCLPNHEVGGDYYDFIPLSNSRLGMVVADVSGDGIPGALVMTAFRALLRTHAATRLPPAGIAHEINQSLPEIAGRSNFVTAVYGVFRPEDGRFRYANCGHNPPLLLRASGETLKLTRTGPLLGMLGESEYEDQDVYLEPGDTLVLYTDGIVEAMSPSDEFFGVQRLEQVVRLTARLPLEGIIPAVVAAVQEFTGLSSFEDDITLVLVQREA
jgi:serine phosphatase RsbU (regulator of sigma subunit)